ncbi:MAG: MotA/TolQ/ExbB proton channel family protein [Opitutaceae bacterium]
MQTIKKPFLALVAAAAFVLPFGHIHAQSISQASEQAQKDLIQANEELNETRSAITKEKLPLIVDVSKLEDEVRKQTAELNRLRRLRDNNDQSLIRLKEQVDASNAQNEYAAGLLDEFVRSFETRIDFSERQLYAEAAEHARLALIDSDLTQAERFTKQVSVIGVALDRLENLVGGYQYEGVALAPTGTIEKGSFAAYGPSVYFASNQSPLTGIATTKVNAAESAIYEASPEFSQGIRDLVEKGDGSIPADATLGKAQKIEASKDSFADVVEKGGSVGVVIIGLGAVCLLIALFKLFEIFTFKSADPSKVQKVMTCIEAADLKGAQDAADTVSGPSGDLLKTGLEHLSDKRGTLEEILYEKILVVRPKLERLLPFIALAAAASPLLGLLGTVTGMINTFKLITVFGTGDAASLSSGISEALITTKLGLIVAIPSLIIHGLLSRMAKQKLGDMEQTAVGFINGVIGARNSGDTK